jgi:hypothetical protein
MHCQTPCLFRMSSAPAQGRRMPSLQGLFSSHWNPQNWSKGCTFSASPGRRARAQPRWLQRGCRTGWAITFSSRRAATGAGPDGASRMLGAHATTGPATVSSGPRGAVLASNSKSRCLLRATLSSPGDALIALGRDASVRAILTARMGVQLLGIVDVVSQHTHASGAARAPFCRRCRRREETVAKLAATLNSTDAPRKRPSNAFWRKMQNISVWAPWGWRCTRL